MCGWVWVGHTCKLEMGGGDGELPNACVAWGRSPTVWVNRHNSHRGRLLLVWGNPFNRIQLGLSWCLPCVKSCLGKPILRGRTLAAPQEKKGGATVLRPRVWFAPASWLFLGQRAPALLKSFDQAGCDVDRVKIHFFLFFHMCIPSIWNVCSIVLGGCYSRRCRFRTLHGGDQTVATSVPCLGVLSKGGG